MNQYCTFHVADLFFGIAVREVQEVLRYQSMTHVPHADPHIRGLINLRGDIVTAVDLRTRLALPPTDVEPMNVVIRRPSGAVVSFLVDRIGDVLDLPASSFEPPPATLQEPARSLISGICQLEDTLLLELDTRAAIGSSVAVPDEGATS